VRHRSLRVSCVLHGLKVRLAERLDSRYARRWHLQELERKVNSLLKPRWQDNPHVFVGEGCAIQNNVAMYASEGREIRIGNSVRLYRNAEMNGPLTIGDECFINRDFYARRGTSIGRGVYFGPFVRIITDTHDIGGPERRAGKNRYLDIEIGDGCWIGAGAIVLGGVTIGAGSIVAAGAVVNRDVPAHSVVAGVPARVVRTLDAEAGTFARECAGHDTTL
jgi:acetyltransferase-like isoleucine patch superfamily enzyme